MRGPPLQSLRPRRQTIYIYLDGGVPRCWFRADGVIEADAIAEAISMAVPPRGAVTVRTRSEYERNWRDPIVGRLPDRGEYIRMSTAGLTAPLPEGALE